MTGRGLVFAVTAAGLVVVLLLSLRPRPEGGPRLEAVLLPALSATATGGQKTLAPPAKPDRRAEQYAYHTSRFTDLIADSYRASAGRPEDFYRWFGSAYAAGKAKMPWHPDLALEPALKARARDLSTLSDANTKRAAELKTCEWLHRMVKATIPRFSLDRGFEFSCTVSRGERQCLLQSVLIAAMLQSMGIDAGTVMVYRNAHGQTSNIGHVVTLVKLAGAKTHVIVDASEQEPFTAHQGLMVRSSDYMFVRPRYGPRPGYLISSYVTEDGRRPIAAPLVRTLDYPYVRSQFYYYRGERAPGGILAAQPSPAGLKASERYLRESVRICPANPLATYMLGRVCLEAGKPTTGRALLKSALRLYARYGWVPEGPKEYMAQALSKQQS